MKLTHIFASLSLASVLLAPGWVMAKPLEHVSQKASFSVSAEAVTVVAYVQVKAGAEEKVREATKVLQKAIRDKEPGNYIFESHSGVNKPGLILFYEVFKDRAAFEKHLAESHTQQWLEEVKPYISGQVELFTLDNFDRK